MLAQQPFWAEVQAVAVSREPKTWLTVAPRLARRPLPVWCDGCFDELRRPTYVDDYTGRVRTAFARPTQAAGDWEPAQAALARFLAGIAALCTAFPSHTLALVGHGLTLSLYRAYLLRQPSVNFDDWTQLSFAAVAIADPVSRRLLQEFQSMAGEQPRGGLTSP